MQIKVFSNRLQDKTCRNFMDDVLIYGKGTLDEHFQDVRKTRIFLRENKFYCNPTKCKWATDGTHSMGHENFQRWSAGTDRGN